MRMIGIVIDILLASFLESIPIETDDIECDNREFKMEISTNIYRNEIYISTVAEHDFVMPQVYASFEDPRSAKIYV